MPSPLIINIARACSAILAACLVAAAYLPQSPASLPILGAAWADHADCNCQYSNSNRGCAVVSDGFCTEGWVSQCETVILNPPNGTCHSNGNHPCPETDPDGFHDCGFIEDEYC